MSCLRILLLPILSLGLSQALFATEAEDIIGWWHLQGESVVIEILPATSNHGAYEGIIRRADKAQAQGKRILEGLQYNPGKQQWSGILHALRQKKVLNAVLKKDSPDQFSMRGSKGWYGKTTIWKRVPAAQGSSS